MEIKKQPETHRYIVLFLVSLGTLMSTYVSSSVNLALPNIMQVFGFTIDSIVWVTLAYMIPYGTALPLLGKFGDIFGRSFERFLEDISLAVIIGVANDIVDERRVHTLAGDLLAEAFGHVGFKVVEQLDQG